MINRLWSCVYRTKPPPPIDSRIFLIYAPTVDTLLIYRIGDLFTGPEEQRLNLLSTFKEAAGVDSRAPIDKSVTVQTYSPESKAGRNSWINKSIGVVADTIFRCVIVDPVGEWGEGQVTN